MGESTQAQRGPRQRVVVVGGGFGGMFAVRALRDVDVEVTLVDRHNFHLFQPLAYQVATGALSAAEIAAPLRAVLKGQTNLHVILAEVTGFDLVRREVIVERLAQWRDRRRAPLRHPDRVGRFTLLVLRSRRLEALRA